MPSGHVDVFLAEVQDGWLGTACKCRQQNVRGLRGAKCWSETEGEDLGKNHIDIVGYTGRWGN